MAWKTNEQWMQIYTSTWYISSLWAVVATEALKHGLCLMPPTSFIYARAEPHLVIYFRILQLQTSAVYQLFNHYLHFRMVACVKLDSACRIRELNPGRSRQIRVCYIAAISRIKSTLRLVSLICRWLCRMLSDQLSKFENERLPFK